MDLLGLLYVCNMHGPLWFVHRFMAPTNGRCTPVRKEKICLEQDVYFGTGDIDMH